jgi:type IV pilus assembly protein PilY1
VLYAFDVTTPGNPQMKWKVGCPNNFPTSGTVDDTNCSTGFTGIGQTWSSAKVFYASGYGSGTSPMIIIGGGYDTCEDTDDGTHNNSCTGSTKGNKIYVLNADTGALLQSFSTDRAVVGDVTLVTDTSTGMLKYAYATDMGGNVYRISGSTANVSIGATAPSTTAGQGWTLTKIASLGCDTTATCNANRKFEYAPDVVYDNGEYVILVGSGDREKPLSSYAATYAVTNYFFMIKDDPTNTTELSSQTATCGSAVICKASLYGITTSATPLQSDLDAKQGWYLALAAHEQVVTSSVSIFGTTTFSTHQPAVNNDADCGSNLGTTLVYNIAYTNAASENGTDSRSQALSGNGLPPSPVAGQVTLDSGQTVPFCIGCSASSPLEGKYETKPSSSSSSSYKSRVYWYIEK